MKSEQYEYKLPEGYIINAESREKLDALVHQLGLSNEQTQQFMDISIQSIEGKLAGKYFLGLAEKSPTEPAASGYLPENAVPPVNRRPKYSSKYSTEIKGE